MEAIIEDVKQKARDSWPGEEGERRAAQVEQLIRDRMAHYAEVLGHPADLILKEIEDRRDYSVVNYYQDAKFPRLDGVRIFETQDELLAAVGDHGFRCPACKGVSNNPYECDTGIELEGEKVCDWKSYGLFGTMGKGLRFTIRSTFLEQPMIDECFMPVAFEEKPGETA